MIRHPIIEADLEALIEEYKPGWLQRAAERTAQFIAAGKYEESSSIWSEIKPVFMALQANKCVFCELQLQSGDLGRIDHDLEHFRPKSSVKSWPLKKSKVSYDFDTGGKGDGYYWLAYDLANYATSCKVCNSPLKSNNFPINGPRATEHRRPRDLTDEQSFLCYPIGDLDTDPQALVSFLVTTAVPASKDTMLARRGRIIIDFFGLNEREDLHRGRARMIMILGEALKAIAEGRDVERNRLIAAKVVASDVPHTSCSRSFARMWQEDEGKAREALNQCIDVFLGVQRRLAAF